MSTPPSILFECPDAAAMDNSPGDTSIDTGVVTVGGTGSLVSGNSDAIVVNLSTPEFAYGLVFDTVG